MSMCIKVLFFLSLFYFFQVPFLFESAIAEELFPESIESPDSDPSKEIEAQKNEKSYFSRFIDWVSANQKSILATFAVITVVTIVIIVSMSGSSSDVPPVVSPPSVTHSNHQYLHEFLKANDGVGVKIGPQYIEKVVVLKDFQGLPTSTVVKNVPHDAIFYSTNLFQSTSGNMYYMYPTEANIVAPEYYDPLHRDLKELMTEFLQSNPRYASIKNAHLVVRDVGLIQPGARNYIPYVEVAPVKLHTIPFTTTLNGVVVSTDVLRDVSGEPLVFRSSYFPTLFFNSNPLIVTHPTMLECIYNGTFPFTGLDQPGFNFTPADLEILPKVTVEPFVDDIPTDVD